MKDHSKHPRSSNMPIVEPKRVSQSIMSKAERERQRATFKSWNINGGGDEAS